MPMQDRYWGGQPNYTFGFNGKENDDEAKGYGNEVDYGARVYDPRVGRFLSLDPLYKKFPELTPYQYASNRPIDGVDRDGLEYIPYIPKFNTEGRSLSSYVGAIDNGVIDILNLGPTFWNSLVSSIQSVKRGTYAEDVKSGAKQFGNGIKETAKQVYDHPLQTLTSPQAVEFGVSLYVGSEILPTTNSGNLLKPGIAVNATAASIAKGSFEYFMNIAKTGDFSTAEDAAVFYSGVGNDMKALEYVKLNPGKVTIDMTTSGKILHDAKLYELFTPEKADEIMKEASGNFARGASGNIKAFVKGAKSDRIYLGKEKPILKSKSNINLNEE